jgi:hypothetical protein
MYNRSLLICSAESCLAHLSHNYPSNAMDFVIVLVSDIIVDIVGLF